MASGQNKNGSKRGGAGRTTRPAAASTRATGSRKSAAQRAQKSVKASAGARNSGSRQARGGGEKLAPVHQLHPRTPEAGRQRAQKSSQSRPGQRSVRRTHQENNGRRRAAKPPVKNRGNGRGGSGGPGSPNGSRTGGNRPNYALRRVIALLILLAITALLVLGVMHATVWLQNKIRTQDQRSAAASVQTVYPDPVACVPKNLDTEVSVPESTTVGAGLTVPITITNRGKQPCLLDIGGASLGAVITSGDDTVWKSTSCPASPTEKQLLIAAEDKTSTSISWDGNRSTSDCSQTGEQAEDGTYRFRLTLGKQNLTDDRVFVIGTASEATARDDSSSN